MRLDELANAGELERLPAGWKEIDGLIKKARRKLSDAGSVKISRETRLEQAYNVILTCALAALRAKGYRILSRASTHYIAIETLRETAGLDEARINYFQTLRNLRHRDIYDAGFEINEEDLSESIKEAVRLLSLIEGLVSENSSD